MSDERTTEELYDIARHGLYSHTFQYHCQGIDALTEITRRANEATVLHAEVQRLTERAAVTDKALELFASRNTECYIYPWCLEHRDKDGCVSDPVTQTIGPCVSNLIKFTLAEAERILREGGCPR